MKRLMIALIRFYQRRISPLHAPCCRFSPTCSTYALQAVERYGALYGGYLAVRRILRCHPFYKGDLYDPVPQQAASLRRRQGLTRGKIIQARRGSRP